jgi:exopolyphosphatase / guanosine-5'-triphosphate,3'-diphosphate pyrophosphatase
LAQERVAVVDLGTNSTRLLVAAVEDGSVRELDRRTDVTRLGEGVDASGRLADSAIGRVTGVLEGYREAIDELGAGRAIGVATSAVRDADNGDEFRAMLSERFAVDVRVISGDEEARLTFAGATAARPAGETETMVIDIGGGSTEYVVGQPGSAPRFHTSTRLGSVRQTERHLGSDPPRAEELEALRDQAREIVEAAVPGELRSAAEAGIAVAGTATSLAAIDLELDPYDPERTHGHRLGLEAAEGMLARLAAIPLPERREVTGLHPDRAPTIVAGAAILIESMRTFGLEEIEISEADLLHGAALVAARGDWTER